MEIFHKFGLNGVMFIAQAVNFLVIFWVLKKFLYKPLREALEARRAKIQKGVDDADAAEKMISDAELHRQALMADTRKEMQSFTKKARHSAEGIRQKIIDDSHLESEAIRKETDEFIAMERKKIEKQAKKVSLDVSQKVLLGVLPKLFEEKDKERIMHQALKQIEKAGIHE